MSDDVQTSRAPIVAKPAQPQTPTADVADFFNRLIERQCQAIHANAGLIFLLPTGARPGGIAAVHQPVGAATLPPITRDQDGNPSGFARQLAAIGQRCAQAADTISEPITLQDSSGLYTTGATHIALASPLRAADQIHGASVLVCDRANTDPTTAHATLAMAGALYEAFMWEQHALAESHAKTRLRETLELIETAQGGADANAMCALFCHELQRRFGCTRVSIGLITGRAIKLAAVSGADEVSRGGGVSEAIENAMEECAMQDIEVLYPTPEHADIDPAHQRATRAHEQLSARYGPSALVSLPLRVQGDLAGVVTLERDPTDPFPPAAIPLLRLIAEFVGPAIWTRRLADRGIFRVTRDRVADAAVAAVGPRHTAVKAILSLIVIALFLGAVIPIPDRVACEAQVEATTYSFIPPPFAGYIDSVDVRPGDPVQKGQRLAAMDTTDLELELARAQSQRASLETQQNEFLNAGDAGQAAIVRQRIEEFQAQIDLVNSRLERARITSPIDGIISRGDIAPLAGAQVDPTTPLFEVVSLDNLLVVLQIPERDVARVQELAADQDQASHGWFTLAARPGTKIPLKLSPNLRPTATAIAGKNVYLIEAAPVDIPDDVVALPGLSGSARLKAGTTRPLAVILRPVVDEARLKLWW